MEFRNWMPGFAGMTALLLAAPAAAEPGFARLYQQQYGYRPACHACHKDGGGTPVNAYGQQFKTAGKNLAAFGRIANDDADRDGGSNAAEAAAKANPGNKASTLASKGDWLETAGLIPREVQAAFPGIRTYLPKDALLTGADLARAKSLGADLSKADENTIYIAVQGQKPAGTALIFPVQHQGKTFFLLLTTDRALAVTSVKPLDTATASSARKTPVYDTFKGIPVDKLPAGQGDSLEAAITRAVKNAGTLLYVRLKGA